MSSINYLSGYQVIHY